MYLQTYGEATVSISVSEVDYTYMYNLVRQASLQRPKGWCGPANNSIKIYIYTQIFNPFTTSGHLQILPCRTPDDFTRQRETLGGERVNIKP